MSQYAIMRFQKCKAGGIAARNRHNERKKTEYKSNPNIDRSKSHLNYHLVQPEGTYKQAYENRVINVHPALIPSFCGEGYYGLHVHEAALAKGVKLTGATVHFVNEICDGGPIILQKAVEIKEGDTPEILQRRVMEEAEWKILPRAIDLFCRGKLSVEGSIVHIAE